jgi:hypothetical protein
MCNYITLVYKVAVSYLERTPTLVITSLMKCEVWVREKRRNIVKGRRWKKERKRARTKEGKMNNLPK